MRTTRDRVNLAQHCLLGDATRHGSLRPVCIVYSVTIVFTMDAQAITSLAVPMANRTLVKPPEVMNLKVLLHVAHMYSHFVAEQTLDALCAPCVLLRVL